MLADNVSHSRDAFSSLNVVINTSWLWDHQQQQDYTWLHPSPDDWLCLSKGNKTIHKEPDAGGSQTKKLKVFYLNTSLKEKQWESSGVEKAQRAQQENLTLQD